jgi:hypothetical protein
MTTDAFGGPKNSYALEELICQEKWHLLQHKMDVALE